MIATIIQPPYLPWLGFFDRVLKADVLVLLDSVAMDRNSRTKFLNRNRLRTSNGWTWLTVPLERADRDQPIFDLRINQAEGWRRRHWKTIEANYRRANHFSEFSPRLEEIYARDWSQIVELNVELMKVLFDGLEVAPKIQRSSEFDLSSKGGDLLIDICHRVNADTYISGPFGRDYIDKAAFDRADIKLLFHDYHHPEYRQVFEGFEPYMSALDLLLICGREGRAVLESSGDTLSET